MSIFNTLVQTASALKSVKSVVDQNRQSFRGSQQSYPSSYGAGDIGLQLSFAEYSYTAANSVAKAGAGDTINLPLPMQLQEAAGIKIGQAELGTSGALAVDLFSGNLSSDDVARQIKNSSVGENINAAEMSDLVANTSEAVKYFSRSAIEGVFSGAGTTADVINGTAVNPHATLNFDGVNLKEYSFTWQFAPRNAGESEGLKNIINTINRHIHPEYEAVLGGASGSLNKALLKYPSLISARLNGVSEDYYNIFKYPMMASNFSVDYSPQRNAMLKDGKPAFVNVTLQMQETKIRTRGDYGG
jgi:hypothetical protein